MKVKNRKENVFTIKIVTDEEQRIFNLEDGQVLYIKSNLLNKYLKTEKLTEIN